MTLSQRFQRLSRPLADLVVQSQRGARHRHGEVGIGWQRLVSLPQAVELVHQRDGPFAEVFELPSTVFWRRRLRW